MFSAGANQIGGNTGNSATVSVAGIYSVTVTGTDGCSATTSSTIVSSIAAIILTNPAISTAIVGIPFSQTLSASGGNAPYSFSLITGALPPGLDLAGTGVLSGAPTQSGSFTLTMQAQDAQGCLSPPTSYSLTVDPPRPDLVPLLYARPSSAYGPTSLSVVVDIIEINDVATSSPIILKITRDARLSLSLPASATNVGSRSVQNAVWSLSDSDPSYYVLTTSTLLAGSAKLSVGLIGELTPGSTAGIFTISSVLVGNPGEVKVNNNADADKVEYFSQ